MPKPECSAAGGFSHLPGQRRTARTAPAWPHSRAARRRPGEESFWNVRGERSALTPTHLGVRGGRQLTRPTPLSSVGAAASQRPVLPPHYNGPIGGAHDDEEYNEGSLSFTRPVFPLPVVPEWHENPWASSPGFAPAVTRDARQGGNRPSSTGLASCHRHRRPPNDPLATCDLVSHDRVRAISSIRQGNKDKQPCSRTTDEIVSSGAAAEGLFCTPYDWVHTVHGGSLIESGLTGVCACRARLPSRAMPQHPSGHGSSVLNVCASYSPSVPLHPT